MKAVAGPDRFFVDEEGKFIGIFRDAVSPETGEVVASVSTPEGSVEVPTAPNAEGLKWSVNDTAWVEDPVEKAAIAVRDAEKDRKASLVAKAKADAVITRLRETSPIQIEDYINANVTDLGSAKTLLMKLAFAIAWLARNEGVPSD